MIPDTSAPKNSSDSDQCLLYLSDGLSEADRQTFESRLATSPDLATELSRQSELLCVLGEVYRVDHASPSFAEPVSVCESVQTLSANSRTLNQVFFRYRRAMLAIAAALTAVIGWSFYQLPSQLSPIAEALPTEPAETEEDLLAKAWATTNTDIQFWNDELDIDTDPDAFLKSAMDESSLSWISGAVESGDSIDG
jgi:cell division septal protein FtsQ